MAKFKVIVTDDRFSSYAPEREALAKVDAELVVCDAKSQEEVQQIVEDADGVLLNLHQLGAPEIAKMQKCKVISRYGVGYNNVDVDAATQKGIWVSRVPDYGADEAVSDQAMALTLDCIRRTTFKYNRILNGEWNLMSAYKIHQVKDSVVGIIGFGHIGSKYAKKISGFSPKEILIYDPYKDEEEIKAAGCKKVSLDYLAENSDIISIHCPEKAETANMIDKHFLSLVKENLILVNTARGGMVDDDALIEALKAKKLSGAGLDVFKMDPVPKDHPYRHLDNVVISDHTGFYTEESLNTLKYKAAENIAQVLLGNKPVYPLNDIK